MRGDVMRRISTKARPSDPPKTHDPYLTWWSSANPPPLVVPFSPFVLYDDINFNCFAIARREMMVLEYSGCNPRYVHRLLSEQMSVKSPCGKNENITTSWPTANVIRRPT
uniref:Uncharacterized protein n=1 Tax=Sipha flava TaxID=143950 RepID=A0A2S2PYR7_9HEMI